MQAAGWLHRVDLEAKENEMMDIVDVVGAEKDGVVRCRLRSCTSRIGTQGTVGKARYAIHSTVVGCVKLRCWMGPLRTRRTERTRVRLAGATPRGQ